VDIERSFYWRIGVAGCKLQQSPTNMRRVITFAIIVFFLNGCKKSNSGSQTSFTIPNGPPAKTAVGTPMGPPLTKTIGPGGGTVLSSDGRVELDFPAGAVAANTDITIQPITNTAPNGSGLAYQLMPEGTKFSIPVTITFHYTEDDANGTNPFLFYIATQDSTGVWQADFKNRTIDTIAKSASLPISHFSDWSLGSNAILFSSPPGVLADQTSEVFVVIANDQGDQTVGGDGEFPLSAMPAVTPVPGSNISNWTVNGKVGGNADDGTIKATGEQAFYTAPASIDKERNVQVAATMNLTLIGWNKGKKVFKTGKDILFDEITLLPQKFSFTVNVKFTYYKSSVLIDDVYTDGASFQVDINGNTSKFSHFNNQVPSVKPTSGSYALTNCEWIFDPIGMVNVSDGLAVVIPTDKSILLNIYHTNTVTPKWKYTDISNGSFYYGGGDQDFGFPPSLKFSAKNEAQHGTNSNGFMVIDWDVNPIP
jgi:hypothetical protein